MLDTVCTPQLPSFNFRPEAEDPVGTDLDQIDADGVLHCLWRGQRSPAGWSFPDECWGRGYCCLVHSWLWVRDDEHPDPF